MTHCEGRAAHDVEDEHTPPVQFCIWAVQLADEQNDEFPVASFMAVLTLVRQVDAHKFLTA